MGILFWLGDRSLFLLSRGGMFRIEETCNALLITVIYILFSDKVRLVASTACFAVSGIVDSLNPSNYEANVDWNVDHIVGQYK